MGRSFLFAPSLRRGNGTGHLRRCLSLMHDMSGMRDMRGTSGGSMRGTSGGPLSSMPDEPVPRLYMPAEERRDEYLQLLELYGISTEQIVEGPQAAKTHIAPNSAAFKADFVIVDRRSTGAGEYEFFSSLGIPVGVDEGGPVRSAFPFLVDTFPLPAEYGEANIADPGLLEVPGMKSDSPVKTGEYPEKFSKILISFGGEDPAGLTEAVLQALGSIYKEPESMLAAPSRITVIEGPLFGRKCEFPHPLQKLKDLHKISLEIVQAPESLNPFYLEHDLVVTSFGLTAYEAAAAGAGVILFHPSEYHRTLARNAGFAEVSSIKRVDKKAFKSLLGNPSRVFSAAASAAPEHRASLSKLLLSLSPPKVSSCPLCRGRTDAAAADLTEIDTTARRPQNRLPVNTTALLREGDRSFFRCGECGLVYQIDFAEPGERYGKEYFFREYREQYGRSYLEDGEHIRSLSRPRIDRLKSMLSGSMLSATPALLDVGCAYGFFLQEAAAAGFLVQGIDISSEAVEYVRGSLGFAAYTGDFSADPPPADIIGNPEAVFDVISMWYVIEHFEQLHSVLDRVYTLLRPGGIFAFSTPNVRGISGRSNLRDFLSASPRDHHTLWTPSAAASILGEGGFRLEKRVSTGHHPERFPFPQKRPLFHFFLGISKIFAMGDTFEVYARKTGDKKQ